MKTQTYPTYQDIKEQLSREDLLEIIDAALDTGDIEQVIEDFIEAEFNTYEEMEDIA
jgi:hypothetical protein